MKKEKKWYALPAHRSLIGALSVLLFLAWLAYSHYRERQTQELVLRLRTLSGPNAHALVYIPTREGLTSRYKQIESVVAKMRSVGRTVLLVNQASVHYKDMGPVNLCKIFLLPEEVRCVDADVERTVRALRCAMPPLPEGETRQSQRWLFKPSNFGLASFDDAGKSAFQWNTTQCAMIYGNFWPVEEREHIPIRLQSEHVALFESAMRTLLGSQSDPFRSLSMSSTTSSPSSSSASSPSLSPSSNHTHIRTAQGKHQKEKERVRTTLRDSFFVVAIHWRRGDQADRCRRQEDTSDNCHSPQQFVSTAKHFLAELQIKANHNQSHWLSSHRGKTPLVYISTNENSPKALQTLRDAGFKLFQHTGVERKTSALKKFLIEAQLMIDADVFYGLGVSGVQSFVQQARRERGKHAYP